MSEPTWRRSSGLLGDLPGWPGPRGREEQELELDIDEEADEPPTVLD